MFEHLDDTRPLPPPTADEVAAVVGGGERLRRRTRRLRIAAVAVPTAAVVAAVAVVVGTSPFSRQSLPDPATSGSPRPAPTGAPDGRSIAPDGPFEALVVRGQQLVAIDSTGRERPVRDLSRFRLKPVDLRYAYISTAGVLTVQAGASASTMGEGHVFVDLLQPSAAPVLAKGGFDQRTWSPDGRRLLSMASGRGPVVIDSATGGETEVDLQGGQMPGGGPSLIWTADGTGIVIQTDDPGQPLAVAPVGGGPLRAEIPTLWERGGRTMHAGGFVLQPQTCAGAAEGCPPGAVRLGGPDGDTTVLYSGQVERTTLFGASLSSDGRSAFVLLGAPEPNTLLVVRSDAALDPQPLATVPVSTTLYAGLGMSPDDVTALITTVVDPAPEAYGIEQHLLPLDGSSPVALRGSFAGWVPTSVIDQIVAAAD